MAYKGDLVKALAALFKGSDKNMTAGYIAARERAEEEADAAKKALVDPAEEEYKRELFKTKQEELVRKIREDVSQEGAPYLRTKPGAPAGYYDVARGRAEGQDIRLGDISPEEIPSMYSPKAITPDFKLDPENAGKMGLMPETPEVMTQETIGSTPEFAEGQRGGFEFKEVAGKKAGGYNKEFDTPEELEIAAQVVYETPDKMGDYLGQKRSQINDYLRKHDMSIPSAVSYRAGNKADAAYNGVNEAYTKLAEAYADIKAQPGIWEQVRGKGLNTLNKYLTIDTPEAKAISRFINNARKFSTTIVRGTGEVGNVSESEREQIMAAELNSIGTLPPDAIVQQMTDARDVFRNIRDNNLDIYWGDWRPKRSRESSKGSATAKPTATQGGKKELTAEQKAAIERLRNSKK